MTLTTLIFGSHWPGCGRAVTWFNYLMVADMAFLNWMTGWQGIGVLWPLWLLTLGTFWMVRFRPWFARDPATGRIVDAAPG